MNALEAQALLEHKRAEDKQRGAAFKIERDRHERADLAARSATANEIYRWRLWRPACIDPAAFVGIEVQRPGRLHPGPLTPTARLMLDAIATAMRQRKPGAHVSATEWARILGKSSRSIRYAKRELRDADLISVVPGPPLGPDERPRSGIGRDGLPRSLWEGRSIIMLRQLGAERIRRTNSLHQIGRLAATAVFRAARRVASATPPRQNLPTTGEEIYRSRSPAPVDNSKSPGKGGVGCADGSDQALTGALRVPSELWRALGVPEPPS